MCSQFHLSVFGMLSGPEVAQRKRKKHGPFILRIKVCYHVWSFHRPYKSEKLLCVLKIPKHFCKSQKLSGFYSKFHVLLISPIVLNGKEHTTEQKCSHTFITAQWRPNKCQVFQSCFTDMHLKDCESTQQERSRKRDITCYPIPRGSQEAYIVF